MARILEWVAFPFSRGSSQPRDRTQVSHIAGRFFTGEPPGKPKSTGVGNLFLLQGIFPTQERNQGLLHCRRILYLLSYQGNLGRTRTGEIIAIPIYIKVKVGGMGQDLSCLGLNQPFWQYYLVSSMKQAVESSPIGQIKSLWYCC